MADNFDKMFDEADEFDNEFDAAEDVGEKSSLERLSANVGGAASDIAGGIHDTMSAGAEELGTVVQGAAQGATLGFVEEIGAGLQNIVSKAGEFIGLDTPSAVDSDLRAQGFKINPDKEGNERTFYTEAKEENVDRLAKLKEESPYLYGIGELGGGILSGIATGGASKLAKGATLVDKLIKAGKVGGAMGSVYGAGQSEGSVLSQKPDEVFDVENIKELGEDILEGGVTGTVAGGVMQGAGSAGAKLLEKPIKALKSIHLPAGIEAFINQAKLGKKGIVSTPSSTRADVALGAKTSARETQRLTNKVTKSILAADNKLSKGVGEAINSHKGTLDISKELHGLIAKAKTASDEFVADPHLDSYVRFLEKMLASKKVTARQISDVQKKLSKLYEAKAGPQKVRDHVTSEILDGMSELSNVLRRDVKGYQEASSKLRLFREKINEKILEPFGLEGHKAIRYADQRNKGAKLTNAIRGTVEQYKSSNTNRGAKEAMKGIIEDVSAETAEGGVLREALGKTGKEFQDMIEDAANTAHSDIQTSARVAFSPNRTTTSGSLWESLVGAGIEKGAKGLNRAAYAAKDYKGSYNLPKDMLASGAKKLQESGIPGAVKYGKLLERGLAEGNQSLINATLFLVNKDPDSREMLFGENNE